MNKVSTVIAFAVLSAAVGFSLVQAQGKSLPGFLSPQTEEPLPPAQAFVLELTANTAGYVAQWQITPGYYLYRHKIKITVDDQPVSLNLPPGETIHDEFFGESQVYRHYLQAPFLLAAATQDDAVLKVSYQGCADLGVCYPPITQELAVRDVAQSMRKPPAAESAAVLPEGRSEQGDIAARFGERSVWMTILAFIGFGLLLTFTPCVLPMIPILSSVIAGSGTRLASGRAFVLSLAYVLAMSVSYAAAGVAIGLSGENLQAWLQTPWVIGLFALVFVLLALSMFGLYELKMPTAIQTRLNTMGSEKSGSVTGAAIMGGVSVLIVGPCVTPPLIGALLFIAQTGDAVIGGLALFSLGIGMGLPLLVFGTSLGKWLPKPGPAWNLSQVIFGLLLLAVAIWLLDRVVPLVVTQYLSALLLLMSGVYFLQVEGLRRAWLMFWRGLGSALLVYAVLLAIAAATGGASFFKPLEHLTQGNERMPHRMLAFQGIKSIDDFEQYRQQATQTRQPILLDFYADWCVACKEMEAFTFNQPQVMEALAGTVKLQADVTKNDAIDKALMRYFNVYGPPAMLFFDRQGREIPAARLVGFVNAEAFTAHVNQFIKAAGTP